MASPAFGDRVRRSHCIQEIRGSEVSEALLLDQKTQAAIGIRAAQRVSRQIVKFRGRHDYYCFRTIDFGLRRRNQLVVQTSRRPLNRRDIALEIFLAIVLPERAARRTFDNAVLAGTAE